MTWLKLEGGRMFNIDTGNLLIATRQGVCFTDGNKTMRLTESDMTDARIELNQLANVVNAYDMKAGKLVRATVPKLKVFKKKRSDKK